MRGNLPYAKIRRIGWTRREELLTSGIGWVVDRIRPDLEERMFAVLTGQPEPQRSETVRINARD